MLLLMGFNFVVFGELFYILSLVLLVIKLECLV